MSVADKFAGQLDCTGKESIFWRVRLISFVSTVSTAFASAVMVAVLLVVEACYLFTFFDSLDQSLLYSLLSHSQCPLVVENGVCLAPLLVHPRIRILQHEHASWDVSHHLGEHVAHELLRHPRLHYHYSCWLVWHHHYDGTILVQSVLEYAVVHHSVVGHCAVEFVLAPVGQPLFVARPMAATTRWTRAKIHSLLPIRYVQSPRVQVSQGQECTTAKCTTDKWWIQ